MVVVEEELIVPNCKNCGESVTDFYAHVFAPPERHGVRVCPNCENTVRDSIEVRRTLAAH